MFCDNCGAEIEDKKKFCDNCGATVRWAKSSDYDEAEKEAISRGKKIPYQPTRPALRRKQIWFPIIFFIFPGMGQLYAEKPLRGVVFLFGAFVIGAVAAVFFNEGRVGATIASCAVFGVIMIGIIIDAVILLKKYNKFIDEHLRLPKSSEKYDKKQS